MKRFYDIHFHAMNLSHPNLLAFLSRVNLWPALLAGSFLGPLITLFTRTYIARALNLLAVMENDLASFFLLLEYSLSHWSSTSGHPPLVQNGTFRIGGEVYDRLVITPLMMDFGSKNIPAATYYRLPPQKPIVEQVVDLFHGIAYYRQMEMCGDAPDTVNITPRTTPPIFEIYPFLGLNTKNYTLREITALLDKYFQHYRGVLQDLQAQFGRFAGDIDEMGSNFFAGIKLYPPLGFDPWPDDDQDEMAKVHYLYAYCSEKSIPITVHVSDGGFIAVRNSNELTSPEKWQTVLAHYPQLKINLAHLGHQEKKTWGIFPKRAWQKQVLDLTERYDHVYTDISCLGFNTDFYRYLRELLDRHSPRLRERLLFGSDFMINLLWITSYNDYLALFDISPLSAEERASFCRWNPERFLFTPEKVNSATFADVA